jgi:hypothetical protein
VNQRDLVVQAGTQKRLDLGSLELAIRETKLDISVEEGGGCSLTSVGHFHVVLDLVVNFRTGEIVVMRPRFSAEVEPLVVVVITFQHHVVARVVVLCVTPSTVIASSARRCNSVKVGTRVGGGALRLLKGL